MYDNDVDVKVNSKQTTKMHTNVFLPHCGMHEQLSLISAALQLSRPEQELPRIYGTNPRA